MKEQRSQPFLCFDSFDGSLQSAERQAPMGVATVEFVDPRDP